MEESQSGRKEKIQRHNQSKHRERFYVTLWLGKEYGNHLFTKLHLTHIMYIIEVLAIKYKQYLLTSVFYTAEILFSGLRISKNTRITEILTTS
jgi:hypothetical protein